VDRARRPATAAALIYALLSLVMVGQGLLPGRTLSGADRVWSATPWSTSAPPEVRTFARSDRLQGSNPLLNDAAVQFQPFLRYTRSTFPHIPLWNPYIGSGRPFLANAQSAVFSPFSVPAYVLPFWQSLALSAWLKLFVAAFGSYLLGRILGMSFSGALLTGVVYAFGLFMVLWLSWPHSNVWAWIPWLFFCTEQIIRRPSAFAIADLSAVVGVQFLGGHPQSSFHALCATAVFFGFRAVQTWRRRHAAWKAVGAFAAAVIAGTALAAIALVPFMELERNSDVAAIRSYFIELSGAAHQPTEALLALFFPDYWGRWTQTPTFYLAFQPEFAYYSGALSLMLAVSGLVLRRTALRIAAATAAILMWAIAVGAQPVFDLVTALPVFHTIKNGRLAIFALLCVALLAGWGLDELMVRRPEARQRRTVLLACAVVSVLPVVWALARGGLTLAAPGHLIGLAGGWERPSGPPFDPTSAVARAVRSAAVLEWLVLAGAAAALIALQLRRPMAPKVFAGLAVSLLVLDLFKAGMGFNPVIPVEHASQPATGAIRYLQARRPERFVGLRPPRGLVVDPVPPNVAMGFGLFDARAYDYPVDRRYRRLWATRMPASFDGAPISVPADPRVLAVLRLLNVKYLVQDPAGPALRFPGLRMVYDGSDARIYRDDRAVPRVFMVHRQRVVADDVQALAAVTADGFDRRGVAVTSHQVRGVPAGVPRATSNGSARVVSYEPQRVSVRAATTEAGMLVLADTYFPGWKATIDGHATPIHRVDYVLRGVQVPPGVHRVVFRYAPASWDLARLISGCAVIALLVLCVIGWRARRGARPANPGPRSESLRG
jgi:hypothetical protein